MFYALHLIFMWRFLGLLIQSYMHILWSPVSLRCEVHRRQNLVTNPMFANKQSYTRSCLPWMHPA